MFLTLLDRRRDVTDLFLTAQLDINDRSLASNLQRVCLSVPQAICPSVYSEGGKNRQVHRRIMYRPALRPPVGFHFISLSCAPGRTAIKGLDEQESNRRRTYFWGCVLLVASGVFFVTAL